MEFFQMYKSLRVEGLASAHQGDPRFGEYAGMQCLSVCVAYLASSYYNNMSPVVDRHALDEVLRLGTKLDFMLRKSQYLSEHQYAQLGHVPGVLEAPRWTCSIYHSPEIFGLVSKESVVNEPFIMSFKTLLERNYQSVTQFILFIYNSLSLAVIISKNKYYLFNPHQTPIIQNSPAHVISTLDSSDILQYLGKPDAEYTACHLYFIPSQYDNEHPQSFILHNYRTMMGNQRNPLHVNTVELEPLLTDYDADEHGQAGVVKIREPRPASPSRRGFPDQTPEFPDGRAPGALPPTTAPTAAHPPRDSTEPSDGVCPRHSIQSNSDGPVRPNDANALPPGSTTALDAALADNPTAPPRPPGIACSEAGTAAPTPPKPQITSGACDLFKAMASTKRKRTLSDDACRYTIADEPDKPLHLSTLHPDLSPTLSDDSWLNEDPPAIDAALESWLRSNAVPGTQPELPADVPSFDDPLQPEDCNLSTHTGPETPRPSPPQPTPPLAHPFTPRRSPPCVPQSDYMCLEFSSPSDPTVDLAPLEAVIREMGQYKHVAGFPTIYHKPTGRPYKEINALTEIDRILTSIIVEQGLLSHATRKPSPAMNLLRFVTLWIRKLEVPTDPMEQLLETDLEIPKVYEAFVVRQTLSGSALEEHFLNKLAACLPKLRASSAPLESDLIQILSRETAAARLSESPVSAPETLDRLLSLILPTEDDYLVLPLPPINDPGASEEADIISAGKRLIGVINAHNVALSEENEYFDSLISALKLFRAHPIPLKPLEINLDKKIKVLAHGLREVEEQIAEDISHVAMTLRDAAGAGHSMETFTYPDVGTVLSRVQATATTVNFCIDELQLSSPDVKAHLQQLLYIGGELSAMTNAIWNYPPQDPVVPLETLAEMRQILAAHQQNIHNEEALGKILDDIEDMLSLIDSCPPAPHPSTSNEISDSDNSTCPAGDLRPPPTFDARPSAVPGATSSASDPRAGHPWTAPDDSNGGDADGALWPGDNEITGDAQFAGTGHPKSIPLFSISVLESYILNAGALVGETVHPRFTRLRDIVHALASSEHFIIQLIEKTALATIENDLAQIGDRLNANPNLSRSHKVHAAFTAATSQLITQALNALQNGEFETLSAEHASALCIFARYCHRAPLIQATQLLAEVARISIDAAAAAFPSADSLRAALEKVKSKIATADVNTVHRRRLYKALRALNEAAKTTNHADTRPDNAPSTPTIPNARPAGERPGNETMDVDAGPASPDAHPTAQPVDKDPLANAGAVNESIKHRGETAWTKIQGAFNNLAFHTLAFEDWAAVFEEYARLGSGFPIQVGEKLLNMISSVKERVEAMTYDKIKSLLPHGQAFQPPLFDWISPYEHNVQFYLTSAAIFMPKVWELAETMTEDFSTLKQALNANDLAMATAGTRFEAHAVNFKDVAWTLETTASDYRMAVLTEVDDYLARVKNSTDVPLPQPPDVTVPATLLNGDLQTRVQGLPEPFKESLLAVEAYLMADIGASFSSARSTLDDARTRYLETANKYRMQFVDVIKIALVDAPGIVAPPKMDSEDPIAFLESILENPAIVSKPTYKESLDALQWLQRIVKSLLVLSPGASKGRLLKIFDGTTKAITRTESFVDLENAANACTDNIGTLDAALNTLAPKRITGGQKTADAWEKRKNELYAVLQNAERVATLAAHLEALITSAQRILAPGGLQDLLARSQDLQDECRRLSPQDDAVAHTAHELTMYITFKKAYLEHYETTQPWVFSEFSLSKPIMAAPAPPTPKHEKRLSHLIGLRKQAPPSTEWRETHLTIDDVRVAYTSTRFNPPLHRQIVYNNFLEPRFLDAPPIGHNIHLSSAPLQGIAPARTGTAASEMFDAQWTDIRAHAREVLDCYVKHDLFTSFRNNEFISMTLLSHALKLAIDDVDQRPPPHTSSITLPLNHAIRALIILWPSAFASVLRQLSFKECVHAAAAMIPSMLQSMPHLTLSAKHAARPPRPGPTVPSHSFLFFPARWTEIPRLQSHLWESEPFYTFAGGTRSRARLCFLAWALQTIQPEVINQLWSSLKPLYAGVEHPSEFWQGLRNLEFGEWAHVSVEKVVTSPTEPPADRGGNDHRRPYGRLAYNSLVVSRIPRDPSAPMPPVDLSAFEVALGALMWKYPVQFYTTPRSPLANHQVTGPVTTATPLLDCSGLAEPFKTFIETGMAQQSLQNESPGREMPSETSDGVEMQVFVRQRLWLTAFSHRAFQKRPKSAPPVIVLVDIDNKVKAAYEAPSAGLSELDDISFFVNTEVKPDWPLDVISADAGPHPPPSQRDILDAVNSSLPTLTAETFFQTFPPNLRGPARDPSPIDQPPTLSPNSSPSHQSSPPISYEETVDRIPPTDPHGRDVPEPPPPQREGGPGASPPRSPLDRRPIARVAEDSPRHQPQRAPALVVKRSRPRTPIQLPKDSIGPAPHTPHPAPVIKIIAPRQEDLYVTSPHKTHLPPAPPPSLATASHNIIPPPTSNPRRRVKICCGDTVDTEPPMSPGPWNPVPTPLLSYEDQTSTAPASSDLSIYPERTSRPLRPPTHAEIEAMPPGEMLPPNPITPHSNKGVKLDTSLPRPECTELRSPGESPDQNPQLGSFAVSPATPTTLASPNSEFPSRPAHTLSPPSHARPRRTENQNTGEVSFPQPSCPSLTLTFPTIQDIISDPNTATSSHGYLVPNPPGIDPPNFLKKTDETKINREKHTIIWFIAQIKNKVLKSTYTLLESIQKIKLLYL
ncbi:large tegument protein [Common bottlenose dolphin gammaherpesvirus 1 strain Sarasota]|uniref:Large tegument protein n=1 Tax=Common bottlenose dolphin gammaherpesvirus 1 strain Sarasota TaxID=2022783 RepID=A0A1Z1NE47_9GAMA|nr:large tegument protein [Common bottlenose dolphin gammaherpesvirus 1 strain Sarasota]ARW78126.1 large tegument protein [Common bottlenose dolphin gammaherpesvirus 1 strain Sarasota]